MAHSSFHFAIGLLLGTAIAGFPVLITLFRLWRGIQTRQSIDLTRLTKRMLLISYGLAIMAVIPNLLRSIGCPEQICSNIVMNIFVLHPLINSIKHGGMLIGELLIIAVFFFQYTMLIATIICMRNIRINDF